MRLQACVSLLAASLFSSAESFAVVKVVAANGDPVPGLPAGETVFAPGERFAVRPDGQVTFVTDTSASSDLRVFGGSIESGVALRGGGQSVAPQFRGVAMAGNGDVLVRGTQELPSERYLLVHRVTAAQATEITRQQNNSFNWSIDGLRADATNHYTFGVTSADNFETSYLCYGTGASVVTLAQRFTPAPGTGANYASLQAPLSMSPDGTVVFRSWLDETFTDQAIFRGKPGTLSPVVRTGDTISSLPGVSINQASEGLSANQSGVMAFNAALAGRGVTSANRAALLKRSASGVLSVIARQGDATADGYFFDFISTNPLVAGNGDIAFFASETAPTASRTVLLTAAAGTNRVAVERESAADLPGVTYDSLDDLALNNLGQIVFHASLAGSGVTSANDMALFAYDPQLGTYLLAREGQTLSTDRGPRVFQGVPRAIGTDLIPSDGPQDGGKLALTDDGYFLTAASTVSSFADALLAIPLAVPGDANFDRRVDVADLGILASRFRTSVAGGFGDADFNRDGIVDVTDLGILAANFRAGTASFAAAATSLGLGEYVPEPQLMIAASGIGLLGRRRRR